MKIPEIMNGIENQIVNVQRARAVYSEVERYLESTENRDLLPHRAEHMMLLLSAADLLLYNALPELDRAVCALQEHQQAEQEAC